MKFEFIFTMLLWIIESNLEVQFTIQGNRYVLEQTDYILSLQMQKLLPSNSIIQLDFSNTQVGTPTGAMQTCFHIDVSTSNQVTYTDCQFNNKVATIVITNQFQVNEVLKLNIGKFTNPPYQMEQIVKMTLTYNDGPKTTEKQDVALAQNLFLPQTITDTVIEQASYKVLIGTTYTLKFKSIKNIAQGCKISITIPGDLSIDVSQAIQVIGQIGSNPQLTFTQANNQLVYSGNIITITGLFATNYVVDGSYISLKVSLIKNPGAVYKSTVGFIIQVTSSQNYMQEKTDNTKTLFPESKESRDITVMQLVPWGNFIIHKEFNFYLAFVPSVAYTNKDQMVLQLPSELGINSATASASSTSNTAQVTVDADNKRIIFRQASNGPVQMFIVVYGVINAKSTKRTSKLQLQVLNENAKLIQEIKSYDFAFTAQAGPLAIASAPQISVNNLDKNVDVTFSITLGNPMDKDGKIQVILPKSVFQVANTSPTCKQANNQAITCSMVTNSSMSVINLNEFCSNGGTTCPANTNMQFKLTNTFKNPSFITQPVESIGIKTLTSDTLYTFDQILAGVTVSPALVTNTFTDLKMEYISSNPTSDVYNKLDTYKIEFTPFDYFKTNGNKVEMKFPKGSLILVDGADPPKCHLSVTGATSNCVYEMYNNNDSMDGIKSIQMVNVCNPVNCPAKVVITISNFHAPLSNQPIDSTSNNYQTLTFTAQGYSISSGSLTKLTNYDSPNLKNLKKVNTAVKPSYSISSQVVGDTNQILTVTIQYNIPFTAANHPVFKMKGKLQLPAAQGELIIASDSQCTVDNIGTITFTCTITDKANGVVEFSYQEAQQDSSKTWKLILNQNMVMKLTKLVNIQSLKPSSNIVQYSTTADSYTSQESSGSMLNQITLTQMNELTQVEVVRDTKTVDQIIILTIKVTLKNKLYYADSIIEITIPFQQVQFLTKTGAALQASDITSGLLIDRDGVQKTIENVVIASDNMKFQFKESCPCETANILTYKLKNSSPSNTAAVTIRNPQVNQLVTNSIQIKTLDKFGYGVDQKLTNIYISPTLETGKITFNSIVSDNRILSKKTLLTINIKLETQLEKNKQAKLTIQFPEKLYYPEKQGSSYALSCQVGSVKLTTCTATLTNENGDNNQPKYISIATLQFTDAELDSFNPIAQSNFDLKIDNVYNYYEFHTEIGTNDIVMTTSVGANNIIINQVTFSINGKNLYPNTKNTFKTVEMERNNFKIDQTTIPKFKLTLQQIIKKDYYINIRIPKSQLRATNTNPACKFIVSSTPSTVSCKLTHETDYMNIEIQNSLISYCDSNSFSYFCELDSIFLIQIDNLINNFELPNLDNIKYFTFTLKDPTKTNLVAESQQDQKLLTPVLQPGAFLNLVVKSDNGIVGKSNTVYIAGQLEAQLLAQSKVVITLSQDIILIANDYQFGCKLAVMDKNAIFSIQDLKDVQCQYKLNTLTNGIKEIMVVNPCRFDSSCPQGTKVNIQFQAANLLYKQVYAGKILMTGYTASNRLTLQTEIPLSSLSALTQYELLLSHLVITRNTDVASASSEITIDFNSPIRLISKAQLIFYLAKDAVTITSKPDCQAVIPTGFDCQFTFTSSDSQYYKITVNQNYCDSFNFMYCEPNQHLKFILKNNINNPAKLKLGSIQYNKVEVTYSSNQVMALVQNYNNLITPLIKTGLIKSIKVTRSSKPAYSVTNLDYEFELSTNVADNGQLIFQFPNEVFIKNGAISLVVKRYSDNQYSSETRDISSSATPQYNTKNYLQQILISSFCSADCNAGTKIYIRIEQLKNNYFISKQDEILRIATLDDQQYVIDSGTIKNSQIVNQIEPEDTQSIVVTRSVKFFTLESDYSFVVDFKSSQYLESTTKVRLTLPSVQLMFGGDSFYVKDKADARIVLTKAEKQTGYYVMEFVVINNSQKKYEFTIVGFQNAVSNPTKNITNSIFVELYTANDEQMTKNTNQVFVSPDMEQQVSQIQDLLINQENFIDGQITKLNCQFKLKTMQTDGQNDFVIELPQYRYYFQNFNDQTKLECQIYNQPLSKYETLNSNECMATYDSTNKYLKQIKFIKICNSKIFCNVNQQKIELMFKVRNQPSLRPFYKNTVNKYFSIVHNKDNVEQFKNQYLYLQPELTASDIKNIQIKTNDLTIQKQNLQMDLSFQLSNIVANQGNISIQLPSQLIQSIPSSCVTEQTIKGTKKTMICKPTSDGLIAVVQSYQIVDTYDLYEQIQMKVVIQGIQNPVTNLLTDPFVIRTYGMYVEDSYLIDKNQQVVQYQATQLGTMKVTSVTRSTADLYKDTILTITFQTENEIPASGFIMLNVSPSYQFEFKVSDGSKLTCRNKLNLGQPIICYVYQTFIKVTDLCGTNTKCNAVTSFELEVSTGIRNPIIANEKTMQIYSAILYKGQHGYIDGLTSNIFALAKLQKTILTLDNFKRSSNDCVQDSQLEVQFKSANAYNFANRSKFMIEFTKDVMFLSANKELKCNVNNVKDVKCDVNYFSDQTDIHSVQYLNIYGFCVTNDPCLPDEVIKVVIDGLINGYEQTDYNSKEIKFRTCITDYNNVYQEAEIVTHYLNRYFQSSVATQSSQVTFRPMNPLSQFANVLQIIIAVNTFQVKDMYILIDFDSNVYNTNFKNVVCHSRFGFDSQTCKVEKLGTSQAKISNFISKSKSNFTLALIELEDFQNTKITNGQNSQQFNFQKVQLMSVKNLLMEKYEDINKMSYKIYKKRSMNDCKDSNCQYCLESNKEYCITCKGQGEYPLFYQNIFDLNQKPQCLNQCPDNSFIYKDKCYNCHPNCKKCYGPIINNCQECDQSTDNKYFDSGKCLKSCMKSSQPIQNDNLYPIASSFICKQSNINKCDSILCPNGSCMSQKKYCSEQCGNNMAFSFYKQECIQQDSCSSYGGYFSLYSSYKNKNNVQYKYCKQCISKCDKCSDNNQSECTQCNQYFTNKYNYQKACVKSCPQKYYAELNTNICKQCAAKCTQCRDSTATGCLSCEQGKKYYYGECLDACPIGSITQDEKCLSNCNNKKCFKCDKNSNTCSACRGVDNILHNGNCYSECPQGTFLKDGQCGSCKPECKSCNDAEKCSLCKDSTKSVFKGTCVDECPEGYSKNYLTTQCMQFYCDKPCAKCGFNENQCWTCADGKYQLDLKCYDSCPSNSFSNSTDLKQCKYCQSPCASCQSLTLCNTCKNPLVLYETQCYQTCPMQYEANDQGVCKFSNYPVLAIIIWCLFLLAIIYFVASLVKQRLKMNKLNSLIFLAAPLQFLTRLCLFISYWYEIKTELMAITFITLATNCILALMFKTYYLTLFEENLRNFEVYMKDNPKFYKICKNVMVVIGVKLTKIFNTGLLFIPKSNFEMLPPYLFSMNRLLFYSLILSIFQLLASIYTLITFNSAKDAFHLSTQDLIFSLVAELSFYYKNYQDLKMKLGYNQLPEKNEQQDDDDDENPEKDIIKDLDEDSLQKQQSKSVEEEQLNSNHQQDQQS